MGVDAVLIPDKRELLGRQWGGICGENMQEPQEQRGMHMKTSGSWKYAVIGLVLICLALPAPIFAEDAPAKTFKQEELDQLLAPIALYPDSLLTQIFMASTYPIEVVQADRWAKQNKGLKGDALKAALEKQSWDDSVQALTTFPEVLNMMSEKLDWTQKLGDAFLAQQKDVMETVQKLRQKAAETGNLKNSKEQEVKKEGDVIIIQPTNPQVVYVPSYNPTVVYGAWPYPAYPPYPVYAYAPGAALFTFSMGVAVGAAWGGWGAHPDWHGGDININRNTNINTGNRPEQRPSGGGARGEQWKHDPEHRKGANYRDTATRDKYSPTNRAAADNRGAYRGYDGSGAGVADRTAGGQPAQVQDRTSDRSDSKAKSSDNAFGGMDRGGAQVSQESVRGRHSMYTSQSAGGKQYKGPDRSYRGAR
jgi:hypothetical protein